jgi:O-methyltransferase involved in polyketide biosynthesis
MTKLSDTSALVLLWAQQECYQTEQARQYLGQLDLEEGRVLYEQCRAVWPYYDEVIKNRKVGVLSLIEKCCSGKIGGQQLIIVGAGLDALGIEVAERYPHITVFELDQDNMEFKSCLFDNLWDESKGNLRCIKIDILDDSALYGRLADHGWSSKKPTILVMEGISYYLPEESIRKMALIIQPEWIVFEFLKQERDISADRRDIPQKVFDIISDQCGSPHIGRYDYSKIEKLFDMPVTSKYSMNRLEEMRTGANRFFPTQESGWIEVCLLTNP